MKSGMAARRIALTLEAFTCFGVVIGIQGFVSGSFEALNEDLSQSVTFVDGPAIPALALGTVVGIPHAVALVSGLRRSPRAPVAAGLAGAVLVGWVAAQYPLVGWTSPLQPTFAAVGAAEVGAALLWRRSAASD